jgi:hypothetical protein
MGAATIRPTIFHFIDDLSYKFSTLYNTVFLVLWPSAPTAADQYVNPGEAHSQKTLNSLFM